MTKKMPVLLLAVVLLMALVIPARAAEEEKTITKTEKGKHDGYDYELWNQDDKGEASMTLKDGGAFSCSWSGIYNVLFRKGIKFDKTKTHGEIGEISMSYDCDYQPVDSSYLSVYGWTVEPLMEYYILESWGNWRPPGVDPLGTIEMNGGTYDIYETTRVNQPSIEGPSTTFPQYWSVRTEKNTSGTISVSEHFKAWESVGLDMSGKLYEVSLVVEGYQSKGTTDVRENIITVNGIPINKTEKEIEASPSPAVAPETPDSPEAEISSPEVSSEAPEAAAEAPSSEVSAPSSNDTGDTGFPWWGWVIGAAILIVAVLAIFLAVKKKK